MKQFSERIALAMVVPSQPDAFDSWQERGAGLEPRVDWRWWHGLNFTLQKEVLDGTFCNTRETPLRGQPDFLNVWDNQRHMDHEFQAGDVVQLKSGGPKMTIGTVGKFGTGGTHGQAKCVWFEGTKRMEAVFELPTLSKSDSGNKPTPLTRSDYPAR